MALAGYNPFPTEAAQTDDKPVTTQLDQHQATFGEGLLGPITDPGGETDWATHAVRAGVGAVTSSLQDVGRAAFNSVDASRYSPDAQAIWGIYKDSLFDMSASLDEKAQASVRASKPDSRSVGFAGQAMQSMGQVITEFGLGSVVGGPAGGVTLASAASGHQTYREVLAQTGDESLARKMGALDATFTGAAFVAPYSVGAKFLPKSTVGQWATQMLVGATTNTALGGANRFASHKMLEAAGFGGMADQYKIIDATALATDAFMGGFLFGPLAHLHTTKAAGEITEAVKKASDANPESLAPTLDSALASNIAHIDATTLAPGLPTNPEAASAHDAALAKATADIAKGADVDISGTGVQHQRFVAHAEPTADRLAFYQDLFDQTVKEADTHGVLQSLKDAEAELAARRNSKPVEESPQAQEVAPAQSRDSTAASQDVAPSKSAGSPQPVRPSGDLFGQDTSRAQALADLEREKDAKRSPNKDVSIETGDPTDLFSKSRNQIDMALAERPALRIAAEPMPAEPGIKPYKPRGVQLGPDERIDSILEYLARHKRGLDRAEAELQGIDPAAFRDRSAKVGVRSAFRKEKGMTFDEAAEHLSESGYPVQNKQGNYDPNVLLDAIHRELGGDKIFSNNNPTMGIDRDLPSHMSAAGAFEAVKENTARVREETPTILETLANCAARLA